MRYDAPRRDWRHVFGPRDREMSVVPSSVINRKKLIELSKVKPSLPEGVTPKDIILKTLNRKEITTDEMFGFVNGIVSGEVNKDMTESWLKAVWVKGLSKSSTVDLTLAMAASGDILDFDDLGPVADKHSSGGIGDKTSLVVAPLVAACGVPVAKMSGKGLGITGGTVDKLESIPGLKMTLSSEAFKAQLEDKGIVIAGQSANLAPADGILYSLRNETDTIDSIPLIAASIMSKKIASGANTLVLDVKVGKGAFMKTEAEAKELARTMVDIGQAFGIKCVAEISDMNQPLGVAVGNALEVKEAIDTLKGGGPTDFRDHCIQTAAEILVLSGKARTIGKARRLITKQLGKNGGALKKFAEMVEAQGGDPKVVTSPDEILPSAAHTQVITATQDGYLSGVNPEIVGQTSMDLGAARPSKDEPVEDAAAGIQVLRKVGDRVKAGEPLFVIHTNSQERIADATANLQGSVDYSVRRVKRLPLTYGVVR